MMTFETLIKEAFNFTDQADSGDIAIAYALIAIAQELHRMNERQDLLEAQKERLAEPLEFE